MRLTALEYSEFAGTDSEWMIEGLTLGPVNLLVGRNGTGKTRALSIISSLAKLLSGQIKEVFAHGSFDAHFLNNGDKLEYNLRHENFEVTLEDFFVNGDKKLHRGQGGIGKIFAQDIEGRSVNMKFQAPARELAVVSRRDKIQHPYLQPLHDWSSAVRHFEFGKTMGHTNLALAVKTPVPELDDRNTEQIVAIFREGEKRFQDAFKEAIKADMSEIGYSLDDIQIRRPANMVILPQGIILPGDVVGISTKEHDLKGLVDQPFMSQGMFRALSIIINTNYFLMSQRASCFLVDDIGEGLDYERSCKLIDLLRRKAHASSLQLIMATNDRFVMNNVPLEEWCLLQRSGHHVRVRNYANSKAAFERFKVTGLNNFDLLRTDFIDKVAANG